MNIGAPPRDGLRVEPGTRRQADAIPPDARIGDRARQSAAAVVLQNDVVPFRDAHIRGGFGKRAAGFAPGILRFLRNGTCVELAVRESPRLRRDQVKHSFGGPILPFGGFQEEKGKRSGLPSPPPEAPPRVGDREVEMLTGPKP